MGLNTNGLGRALILVFILVLAGAPGKDIRAGGAALSDRISAEIAEFVTQRVTLPYDSISVDVDAPAVDARAADVAHFSVDLFSTSNQVVGTVPVKVTLVLRSGETIPQSATARVRIWSTAAVAARRLRRHEVLAPEDVRLERREVTRASDGYFVLTEDVLGQRTTRVISSGALLMVSSVEPVPLISRGSDVCVTVVIGAVAITSRARALEDGHLGSLIEVRDSATGRRLTGEVAGENLVVLQVSRL
jgi:flagella basal body P-ring formation protein FlgA